MLWDRCDFEYLARVPWPESASEQRDWVWSIQTLETWLTQNVGSRYHFWAWYPEPQVRDKACVCFRYDPHRTLFVLAWAI
jgi:hypothetical protein